MYCLLQADDSAENIFVLGRLFVSLTDSDHICLNKIIWTIIVENQNLMFSFLEWSKVKKCSYSSWDWYLVCFNTFFSTGGKCFCSLDGDSPLPESPTFSLAKTAVNLSTDLSLSQFRGWRCLYSVSVCWVIVNFTDKAYLSCPSALSCQPLFLTSGGVRGP